MIALATAVFFVIAEEGPIPTFHIETYDLCVELLQISLADAKCVDLAEAEKEEQ